MNKPEPSARPAPEAPLQLASGQDDDNDMFIDPPKPLFSEELNGIGESGDATSLENPANATTVPAERSSIVDALRWALDCLQEPAMASADWLARDIDPATNSAADLLSNPLISLAQVRQAKTVFKTMRIVGEKSADRRVGARMYAAAIAAGLVRHKKLISSQSNAALRRAFQSLLDDRQMPQSLRDLAGMALCLIGQYK